MPYSVPKAEASTQQSDGSKEGGDSKEKDQVKDQPTTQTGQATTNAVPDEGKAERWVIVYDDSHETN